VAWASEPVAVLTDFRVATGEIRVKRVNETDWTAPQPLLSLRPGDQVLATGDARAVLVFAGGGVAAVSAANSPFPIQVPRTPSESEKARAVLRGVIQFLSGQQNGPQYAALSVRGVGPEPTRIVSPRDTRLLPGPVTFEWTGPGSLRYHVRVVGPRGQQWEQSDLSRQPLDYPASAPPLRQGERYTWELTAPGQPLQRAQFEILSGAEADRIEAALADLRPSTLVGYPPSTVVLVRAGFLLQEGLHATARRNLLDGIAADPESPALHLLLGQVYGRIGLSDLAARAVAEANSLSTPKP
jgi:hypothetical protein